jgi:serine/threonine protein kinase
VIICKSYYNNYNLISYLLIIFCYCVSSQALNELNVLNRYRIDNILPIYGVSLDGPEPCLLYQYMPNGSLEDRFVIEIVSKIRVKI